MAKFDILAFIDDLEPGVRTAFLDSIYDIQDSASITAIATAISAGRFEDVFDLLNVRPEMFALYREAFRSAYAATGSAFVRSVQLPPNPAFGSASIAVARFDMSNPRAEAWVRDQSSRLITQITRETRESVQTLLTNAIQQGVGPRTAALDIVGRYDRTAGRRVGGVIGLNSPQERYLANARSELLSGDPAQLENYLTRKRRDRRFDSVVRKAIRDGTPVPPATARKMASRYSDGLLKLRGETVARTEMLQGLHNAQEEGLNQMVERGQLSRDEIKKTWDASNDGDTRDSHVGMDGQKPDENGVFTTGDGFKMKYPGDRSLGAPPQEIINCRCRVEIDINFVGRLRNG